MRKPCDPKPRGGTEITLDMLRPDESGTVLSLQSGDSMRRRLLDLGLAEGTQIRCVGRSPAGDPAAYRIRGAIIALRRADSRAIRIRRAETEECPWD